MSKEEENNEDNKGQDNVQELCKTIVDTFEFKMETLIQTARKADMLDAGHGLTVERDRENLKWELVITDAETNKPLEPRAKPKWVKAPLCDADDRAKAQPADFVRLWKPLDLYIISLQGFVPDRDPTFGINDNGELEQSTNI